MATPAALIAFAATNEYPIKYIVRPMNLDPGSIGGGDQLQNLWAVREGACSRPTGRVTVPSIWIITEADRSVTSILLPEEY